MGVVQEILNFFEKFIFFQTVYEYQQGLHFRFGKVVKHQIRFNEKDPKDSKRLEEIVVEEKKLVQDSGGYSAFVMPFRKPIMPEGYERSFWTGLPLSGKRFDKILRQGVYFFVPFLEEVVTDSCKQRVVKLEKKISVPTVDDPSKVVVIGGNIRYEIMNYDKAYTEVDDYEESLKDHTLSILAQHSRGKTYKEWTQPDTIEKLQEAVLMEVRKIVTDDWGLKVHKIYITDNVVCDVQKVLYEGNPLLVPATNGLVKEKPN